jgi:putative sigma-54 modulation protein
MFRYDQAEEALPGDLSPETLARVVRIKNIDYKPMDVDEAVLQMDVGNNNFLVFTNSQSEEVNVLYRLKDGNYGLIRPSS